MTTACLTIMREIRKLFPCEGLSEPICDEVYRAITHGEKPQFEPVRCTCTKDGERTVCRYSQNKLENLMEEAGILYKIDELIELDKSEEGEWR